MSGADDPSDMALARLFADRGDERAFRALYRRHASAVFGLLCRLGGADQGAAADLLQETWIRAAAAMGAFRGEARFRTWLSGVAVNCHREWRRRQRPEEPLETVPAPQAPPPAQALEVETVLAGLPADFREVIVLHDVEGYTHEEIAQALGIEPGTSKSRLSRGRRLFRASWCGPAGGGEP